MAEIKDIPIGSIDPESTVNVRRSQIEQSVAKVKASIAEHGYWRNNPISIRPHPDSSSQFEYEVITGRCRLGACLELGLEHIPADIHEVDDEAAIRQSWAENEGRSDITPSDKAYWVHKIVTRYAREGKTLTECREIAAKFFAMSVQTVIQYHPMAFLPEEVKKMMDDGSLRIQDAKAIAKSTYDWSNPERSEEAMKERAEWVMGLNRDEKKECAQVLQKLSPAASVEDLDNEVKNRVRQQTTIVQVAIPEDLRGELVRWGEERGLIDTDEATIISYMVIETLRGV